MTFSPLSLRPMVFGLATLLAGGAATSAAACPDWRQSGAPLSYTADQLWVPQSTGVVAGGNVNLASCPGVPGNGYVITQPDFDLSFTENGAARDLEFRVQGTCDTVLLVNDANGTWHFDDDSGGDFNPRLRLTAAPAGAYDIWVGTYGPATCQATLWLETFGGTYAPGGTPAPTTPYTPPSTPPAPPPSAGGYPDAPGNMMEYRTQVGQTLTFTVTGSSQGSVWGTGVYTDDSSVAAVAVHAGVLQPGQTGAVAVTILPGQQSYQGSAAHGVQSANYGSWSGSYSVAPHAAAAQHPAGPRNLMEYRDQVGNTLTFTVTGATNETVWGSGVYTDDSSLATAAVHAGVLQPGQTGTVYVTILPGQQSYSGSSAHGVQSANYGSWSGSYRLSGSISPDYAGTATPPTATPPTATPPAPTPTPTPPAGGK